MHGILQENAGVNSKDFQTEDEFFAYLDRSALFTAERNGQSYYFYPIAANEYLSQKTIEAYSLSGEKVNLTPREADFKNHRSYQYQDLTTRGTVEFRSVCTQPFDRTFSSAAFHLGILENLESVKAYLQNAPFFQEESRDYKALRRKFSKKELTASETDHIYEFTKTLLQLARAGLLARQLGEEAYLPTL